ncbi:MAG: undecaprenyldiphospho-muramoylpentapeptide beta-N-acetylglucosaminyltransferase [Nitrospirota bacterium]
MNVVIAGGGTGGHLYPCVALAHTFMKREVGTEILFIGTAAGMEAKVVPAQGFQFRPIFSQGFIGKSVLGKIRALCFMLVGLFQSLSHLKRFSPDLVIGIGGYASSPVMLAAFLLRIKRVILEPNLIPGIMNKISAPFVHLVITAFHETKNLLRAKNVACLGVPVRAEILGLKSAPAKNKEGRREKTLLVLGGSQGAHTINQAVVNALPLLERASIRIVHQTGEKDYEAVAKAYQKQSMNGQVFKFIEKISEAYADADFVLSRAGAGTLSELAIAGLPSLLVPFTGAKGHQEKNAQPFVKAGAAEMIANHDLKGEMLAERILFYLSHPEKLSEMAKAANQLGHPNAADEIVSACFLLVRGDSVEAAGN